MKRLHTHYDNLKVTADASDEVIRAAYRALSQKHHPDRNPDNADAHRIMSIINQSYAVLSDPQLAVGRVARRALGAGTLLGANDLVAPRIIRRGDSVALVSRRGGVEVRVAGKALGDAGQDERVSVENLSSRRVVQGIVAASGDVVVSR